MASKHQKKVIVVIASIIVTLMILFVGWVMMIGYEVFSGNSTSSRLDLPVGVGSTTEIIDGSDSSSSSFGRVAPFYDSVEDALENSKATVFRESKGEILFLSEPVVSLEDPGRVINLYLADREVSDGKISNFYLVEFFEQDGLWGITQSAQNPIPLLYDNLYIGRPEDESAQEKIGEYIIRNLAYSLRMGSERQIIYGVYPDQTIEELTILGKAPTDIVEFEYNDQLYYVWYYDSYDVDIYGTLASDPDFDFGNFTLRQLIEVLDIEIPNT